MTLAVRAEVRLPSMISDKMVLQRDTKLRIWGWANPTEKVTVRFAGKYYYTEGTPEGRWSVELPPQQAGGPHIIEVNEIVIRDILFGDVWLCSGQSNMETPIARLVEKYPQINVSNNHMIRYFKVPTQNTVMALQENIPNGSKWYSGVASEVMNWTALVYFYAQEAFNHTKIPQGMLVSSLGGSVIESWISQENLREFPALKIDFKALDSLKYHECDQGMPNWTFNDFDDRNWTKTTIPSTWREQDINHRGVVYYRKTIQLPREKEGRHGKLYLGNLTDSDSVFINGKFVGSTFYQYPPRKYDIPAGVLQTGENTITVRLRANNGNGEFVADKEYKLQVDDFETDLRGEWKYKITVDLNKVQEFRAKLSNSRTAGSGLFNGMIYPLKDYAIKGIIWYQGESNALNPNSYQQLLELLITNWRTVWKNEQLPFLIVQLPNFMQKQEQPSESGWARIRDAQFIVSKHVANTFLAVTYDVGEWNDIHPLNKKDIAKRLFLGARAVIYKEKLISSGPAYSDFKIVNDKIEIVFVENGSKLKAKDNSLLKHFSIAGEDKKFIWATAVIKGNKIIVSHPDIKNPKAVRYAWSDNPAEANLINQEGLLASPFRTDNW